MNAQAGVLFDVDGTLVDTAYVHTVCWAQALADAGLHPPMATVHRAVGMGADRLVDHVLGTAPGPDVTAEVTRGHDERFARWHDRLTPLPGARALVEHCARRGLVVVLASSSNERDLGALRSALGADEWVALATSSGDAEASKPSPDILGVALERAGLVPERAVAVGDAVWDAYAASALGVPFVGVETGGTSAAELLGAGAVGVASGAAQLLAEFDRTPLGRLTA